MQGRKGCGVACCCGLPCAHEARRWLSIGRQRQQARSIPAAGKGTVVEATGTAAEGRGRVAEGKGLGEGERGWGAAGEKGLGEEERGLGVGGRGWGEAGEKGSGEGEKGMAEGEGMAGAERGWVDGAEGGRTEGEGTFPAAAGLGKPWEGAGCVLAGAAQARPEAGCARWWQHWGCRQCRLQAGEGRSCCQTLSQHPGRCGCSAL